MARTPPFAANGDVLTMGVCWLRENSRIFDFYKEKLYITSTPIQATVRGGKLRKEEAARLPRRGFFFYGLIIAQKQTNYKRTAKTNDLALQQSHSVIWLHASCQDAPPRAQMTPQVATQTPVTKHRPKLPKHEKPPCSLTCTPQRGSIYFPLRECLLTCATPEAANPCARAVSILSPATRGHHPRPQKRTLCDSTALA
jgi:hypothetical protein